MKPQRLTGLGSRAWLGRFFFTALGVIAVAVASVGNSMAMQRLWAEVAGLQLELSAMQKTRQLSPPPHQSQ